MTATEEWASDARDRIHNLDMSLEAHREKYNQIAEEFIMQNEIVYTNDGKPLFNEQVRRGEYDNAKPPRFTIGIGFNMDRIEARQEWNEVFNGEINFDKTKMRKTRLTNDQIMKLFRYIRQTRLSEIKKIYKEHWHKLKPNEMLAIEDAYFNSPKLVKGSTNFAANIKLYVETSNTEYLKRAIYEIKEKSGSSGSEGVKNRRNTQAEMLSSHKSPLYCKPHESCFPEHRSNVNAIPGKTIIPINSYEDVFKRYLKQGIEPQYEPFRTSRVGYYYIWRTQADEKVRHSHQENDGKIFSLEEKPDTGDPGTEYGCRCYADFNIPEFVKIKGN